MKLFSIKDKSLNKYFDYQSTFPEINFLNFKKALHFIDYSLRKKELRQNCLNSFFYYSASTDTNSSISLKLTIVLLSIISFILSEDLSQ